MSVTNTIEGSASAAAAPIPGIDRGAAARNGWTRMGQLVKSLGPGIVTGAADDDPSGIATYVQTGAQFGYGQLWTALFTLPLMTAVQEACARIGAVNGQGIAAVVRAHYGKPVLYAMVALTLVANTVNIGADLGAMAAAANLLMPVPPAVLTVAFAAAVLVLEGFSSYAAYSRVLKWLTVFLLAYPATALIVQEPWGELLRATLVPHVELSFAFVFIITGVLGTTISPYMFFWQASEEVEEERAQGLIDATGRPKIDGSFLRTLRVDNALGMLSSQATTWSIIVVGATVLHAHGVTTVSTAADAARALEPLVQSFPNAGVLAKGLFAAGIVGLGLLAVPVLSGSSAYALSEAFGWREGLSRAMPDARQFYGVIAAATLAGVAMNAIGVDPMRALVYTAVINGVVAVPLLLVIARVAERRDIMGDLASGPLSRVLVWLTVLAMATAALAMFVTMSAA